LDSGRVTKPHRILKCDEILKKFFWPIEVGVFQCHPALDAMLGDVLDEFGGSAPSMTGVGPTHDSCQAIMVACKSALCGAPHKADYVDASIMLSFLRRDSEKPVTMGLSGS